MLSSITRLFGRGPALRVIPVWLEPITGGGIRFLGIQVVNDDRSAVTVTEVGFLLAGDRKLRFLTGLKGGGFLPQRLAPGAHVTIPAPQVAEDAPPLREARCAYAKTDGGDTITGTSDVIREVSGCPF